MSNKRFCYAKVAAVTVFMGLLSRQVPFVPVIVGDILYAVLIYFLFRFFIFKIKSHFVALLSLVFCFAIEFQQLLQLQWLLQIRATKIGQLVLGKEFLGEDLLAYFVGSVCALLLDNLFFSKTKDVL